MKRKKENGETVEAISQSIRELLKQKRVEKITVNEISKKSNIHRITFYYHFQDKYSLLDFVFTENMNEILNRNSGKSIKETIIDLFKHLSENEQMYMNAFTSNEYQSLEGIYLRTTREYFNEIIDQLSVSGKLLVEKKYLIEFYSHASTKFIVDWVKNENRDESWYAATQLVNMIELGFGKCIGMH